MKKTIKYICSFVIASALFTSCEDPYANQTVAKPTVYEQEVFQDTTGFAAVLKAATLTIPANKLTEPLALVTCTSVLNVSDTAAKKSYRLDFSNVATFTNYKTIAITFDGKAGSDVKVGCKEFNDSIKVYNKNAVQRTVYVRLISYIVKGGLKAMYASKTLPLLVTPNNYVPLLLNDIASLPMNSSIDIDVLANDTDPEKDALTIASVTAPTNGTAVITGNKVRYTPTVGYSGADNFSYTISDGNGNSVVANVDINVMAIMPFYATTPKPYYIVGLGGNWNNSLDGLGSSLIPLGLSTGDVYNLSGEGTFVYTGYFSASTSFKLVGAIGDWNEQWGNADSDGIDKLVHNNGGSKNLKVPTDGYYTITLNSISHTLSIVPALITPPSHTTTGIGLIGEMTSWGSDIVMTPNTNANSHIWYATATFANDFTPPVGNGGCKFREVGNWNTNWGAGYFPCGIGTNNGTNIPFKAGVYTFILNDIDGSYYFIKKP